MTTEITREEMIKWVNENQTCASVDMPDWLLELSLSLVEVEEAQDFFRDLFAIAHLRAVAKEKEQIAFDLDDIKDEVVLFLNNFNFVINIEVMRRNGDFFQMYIEDVFALDYDSKVIIYRKNAKETVSLEDILQEFSEQENEDDDY